MFKRNICEFCYVICMLITMDHVHRAKEVSNFTISPSVKCLREYGVCATRGSMLVSMYHLSETERHELSSHQGSHSIFPPSSSTLSPFWGVLHLTLSHIHISDSPALSSHPHHSQKSPYTFLIRKPPCKSCPPMVHTYVD